MNAAPLAARAPRLLPSLTLAAALLAAPSRAHAAEVRVELRGERYDVLVDGELFLSVHHKANPTPYVHPVLAPGGVPMTRAWPVAEWREHEQKDHPHHRSLWFAHGDVNGHDFWHGGKQGDRIVPMGVFDARSGEVGILYGAYQWWGRGGELVAHEERTLRFQAEGDRRYVDFEITLRPAGSELRFGDTKEGTMALRTTPELRLKGVVAKGNARNSEGVEGPSAWGKRARWVSYWGPVGGGEHGLAMLDHPANASYPTWWHARDYGLVAANPFGRHDFEGGPKGAGERVLKPGQSMTLRYRVIVHTGELSAAELDREHERFAAQRTANEQYKRNPIGTRRPAKLIQDGFEFTEGPVWSPAEGALYFSDIPANRIYRWNSEGEVEVARGDSRNSNGLAIDAAGRLLACEHGSRRITAASLTRLEEPEVVAATFDGKQLNSPNDIVLGRRGEIFFTDPPYGLNGGPSDVGACNVYKLAADGTLTVIHSGETDTRPNGIRLAPDGSVLYVAFTREGVVRAFPIAADGTVGAGRVFVKTEGNPDGMAVDTLGNLFVATRAGIEVFAPDGERWGVVKVPEQPTNCAFGGHDAKTLFITARKGLYQVKVDVPGEV